MNQGDEKALISAWSAAHRLPQAHLVRWLNLAAADGAAMLALTQDLRLRTGQFVTAFEMLEEIAVREGTSISEVLQHRELRQIIDSGGSAPGKARALLEAMRAIRYPRLRRMSERIRAQVRALALPAGIQVVLPVDLSSDELRVELAAHGSTELEKLLKVLVAKTDSLCRIADALGGDHV
jgi:hypothetical protein